MTFVVRCSRTPSGAAVIARSRDRPSFLARFDHPDVSNVPTENLNLNIKNTKH